MPALAAWAWSSAENSSASSPCGAIALMANVRAVARIAASSSVSNR